MAVLHRPVQKMHMSFSQKWAGLDWPFRFPASLSRSIAEQSMWQTWAAIRVQDWSSQRLDCLSLHQTDCGALSQYSFSLMYSCSCNFNVICGRIQMVGSWMGAARRHWRCQQPWVHNNSPNATHTQSPSPLLKHCSIERGIPAPFSLTYYHFIKQLCLKFVSFMLKFTASFIQKVASGTINSQTDYLCMYLCIYLFIYLFIHLSKCMYIYIYIYIYR